MAEIGSKRRRWLISEYSTNTVRTYPCVSDRCPNVKFFWYSQICHSSSAKVKEIPSPLYYLSIFCEMYRIHTFTPWFNVISQNGSTTWIRVGPTQFDWTHGFAEFQVPWPSRWTTLRSSGDITNDWRSVIDSLCTYWECIGDSFFQIVDKKKSIGDSLLDLFRVICK